MINQKSPPRKITIIQSLYNDNDLPLNLINSPDHNKICYVCDNISALYNHKNFIQCLHLLMRGLL